MNININLMMPYTIILFIKNHVNSGNVGAINLIRVSCTINHSILMASPAMLK